MRWFSSLLCGVKSGFIMVLLSYLCFPSWCKPLFVRAAATWALFLLWFGKCLGHGHGSFYRLFERKNDMIFLHKIPMLFDRLP